MGRRSGMERWRRGTREEVESKPLRKRKGERRTRKEEDGEEKPERK